MIYPDKEKAIRAQADPQFRETFIAESAEFIKAAAGRTLHHYVTEHDDEWSIALIAFNESIDSYIEERGDFASFAGMVINRRLTDELRKSYRTSSEIPVSPEVMSDNGREDDEPGFHTEVRTAMSKSAEAAYESEKRTAKDEIEAVQAVLKEYGFSFFDLADCSPKAAKTKAECAKAAGAILRDEKLFAMMRKSKTLPIKEIVEASGVKRKTIDRHRRYIIAAAEILNGEYPLLATYMEYIRESLKT